MGDGLRGAADGSEPVVGWWLTRSLSLDEVTPYLHEIANRPDSKIKEVHTDRCCQDALILRSVFGDDVRIGLDIWHAEQRVVGHTRAYIP